MLQKLSGFVLQQVSGFAAAVVRMCCSSCQDVSRRRDRSWQEDIKQLKRREIFIHGKSIGQCRRQYLCNIAQLEVNLSLKCIKPPSMVYIYSVADPMTFWCGSGSGSVSADPCL